MKTKKRQKLCYNCEGEVDLDVIVCPFCAADLRVEKPEMQRPTFDPSDNLRNFSTQESLYPPHYAPKVEVDGYPAQGEMDAEFVSEKQVEQSADPLSRHIHVEEEEEQKSIIGPTILVTLGSQLLLFGLFMLLFSHNGVLMLKWDARLWFFYILTSVPLLIFGYRSISKL